MKNKLKVNELTLEKTFEQGFKDFIIYSSFCFSSLSLSI